MTHEQSSPWNVEIVAFQKKNYPLEDKFTEFSQVTTELDYQVHGLGAQWANGNHGTIVTFLSMYKRSFKSNYNNILLIMILHLKFKLIRQQWRFKKMNNINNNSYYKNEPRFAVCPSVRQTLQ